VLRLSRHAADTEEATAELHRRLAVAGSGAPGEHRRLAEAHLARARNDRALAARAAAVLACHRARGGHEEPQPGTRRPATPVPPPR
jgi:hypothetical protein